jgi:hypothetical protein
MIKKICFVIMLLFAIDSGHSQQIDLGPKLGANFATLGDIEEFDNEIGFVGGFFLTLDFNKFYLQTELLYSQQGGSFDVFEFDLDYINVPVLIKFDIIGSLNFQFGPQFGFLIEDNIPDSIVDSFETDTFDLSGVGGLGINLPLNLRADARYIFDLSNDFKTADFDSGYYMLTIGFTFL